jgi:hypothetical protein
MNKTPETTSTSYAELALGDPVATVSAVETEMADRLRRIVTHIGEGSISVTSKLLLQAADECDRFYGGMMNWKANAQAKDRTIIELREKLAQVSPAGAQNAPIKLDNIEQYRMQMAGISTAAFGYWKEGDSIHPDYDTVPLRDVAKLYAKYAALYEGAQNAEVIRNQALEEAALAAEKVQNDYSEQQGGKWPELRDDAATGAGDCVTAIRALQTGSANTQEGDA